MSRFSYAISEDADRVIEDEMSQYGSTKNSAINKLIERIPRMRSDYNTSIQKIRDLEKEIAKLQNQLDKEKERAGLDKARFKALREIFGMEQIEFLLMEFKKDLDLLKPKKSKPEKT